MDDADITAEREAAAAPYLLAASKRPEGPAPTGECFWCGETVADHMRWCDSECRDQYEREQRAVSRGRGA